jgi:hypothetical protein
LYVLVPQTGGEDMSEDNPYYKAMFDCRNLDAMFKKHFLGTWNCAPGPLSVERLLTLANDVRKAEFCTIEETMSMVYELLEARRMAEKPTDKCPDCGYAPGERTSKVRR